MSKQCLDVHQMQHLQELGLELKETMLYWARCVDNNPRAATHYGKWVLIKGNNAQTVGLMHWEFIPAYTLQDVLDALPNRIYDKGAFYLGCYDIMIDEHNICYAKWCGSEIESTYVEIEIKDNLIDAAYELLVWCIENKCVDPHKNE